MLDTGPASAVILPPPAPGQTATWWVWGILVVAPLLLWLLWRNYQTGNAYRLRRLRRDLTDNLKTPRRVAHALAALCRNSDTNKMDGELDKTRFQRQEPSREQILALIRQIERQERKKIN